MEQESADLYQEQLDLSVEMEYDSVQICAKLKKVRGQFDGNAKIKQGIH